MLRAEHLNVSYGLFQALFDVSVEIDAGEAVALVGSNGAGKTTLLRTIAGALGANTDAITLDGASIGNATERAQLARGIALVPEGRRLFPSLTVHENLLLAQDNGRAGRWDVDQVLAELPMLKGLLKRPATALSGGQQQQVAIARALVANPDYLLCDEVSLGLSPLAVDEVYVLLAKVRQAGAAIVLVEQNVRRAIASSDRYYCLRKGRIVLDGDSAHADKHAIAQAYFGV